MERARAIVWIPSDDGQSVHEHATDTRWIRIPGNDAIAASILSDTRSSGDEARVSLFMTGQIRLLDYYIRYLPGIDTNGRRRDDADESSLFPRNALSERQDDYEWLDHAREFSRLMIGGTMRRTRTARDKNNTELSMCARVASIRSLRKQVCVMFGE